MLTISAFFGLSNLLRLITGEDKEIEVEDSVDGSSSGIMPSFVLTDSDSADEILQDAKPSDLLESRKPSVKNVARRSQSWLTKHERHANTGIVRWKDQQECKDGENTSNKGYIENSILVAFNQSCQQDKAPLAYLIYITTIQKVAYSHKNMARHLCMKLHDLPDRANFICVCAYT